MRLGPATMGMVSSSRPTPGQRSAAVLAALACITIAGYLLIHRGAQDNVRAASELAIEREFEQARAVAEKVDRRPAATRALVIRAQVAQVLDRHIEAVRLFRRAAERDPRAWHVHRDWAVSLRVLGRRAEARRRLEIAASLNPRLVPPVGF